MSGPSQVQSLPAGPDSLMQLPWPPGAGEAGLPLAPRTGFFQALPNACCSQPDPHPSCSTEPGPDMTDMTDEEGQWAGLHAPVAASGFVLRGRRRKGVPADRRRFPRWRGAVDQDKGELLSDPRPTTRLCLLAHTSHQRAPGQVAEAGPLVPLLIGCVSDAGGLERVSWSLSVLGLGRSGQHGLLGPPWTLKGGAPSPEADMSGSFSPLFLAALQGQD